MPTGTYNACPDSRNRADNNPGQPALQNSGDRPGFPEVANLQAAEPN